jgi:hypothetical protein
LYWQKLNGIVRQGAPLHLVSLSAGADADTVTKNCPYKSILNNARFFAAVP